MLPILLRPVRRLCSVPLCRNRATHIVSRTSAPGSVSICLCDDCIRDIYHARFPDADNKDKESAVHDDDNDIDKDKDIKTLSDDGEEEDAKDAPDVVKSSRGRRKQR